jgi:ribonuclease HI
MYKLRFDGGSTPNPGEGAGAFVVYLNDQVICQGGKYIPYGTNNVCEYTGLMEGLLVCIQNGWNHVEVEGDSLLVVNQINGVWKVNHPELKKYHQEVKSMILKLNHFSIQHIYRKFNSVADHLCGITKLKKQSWIEYK